MPIRLGPIAIVLWQLMASATRADEPGRVQGRILDQAGQPVSGASVAGFWSANGMNWEQVLAVREKEPEKLWRDEGKMEPWGESRVVTDSDGRFSIPPERRRDSLMAYDRERKHGAVVLFDPKHLEGVVEVKLQPLVRIFGSTRLDGSEAPLKWASVTLHLPTNDQSPLTFRSLAICGSFQARFEFQVPPGTYELGGFSDEPTAINREPRSVTITGDQKDVDLGVLRLHRCVLITERINQAKARGTWGDYRKILGHEPPAWHVTDARGLAKDAKLADFKGKWTLLYFWGPNCAPCLSKDIPELMAFYEAHKDRRDRFEILAFCNDFNGNIPDIATLDRQLESVKKSVWGGKAMPFPVLLDNTCQTFERFGREGSDISTYLLIDPEGKIAEGDLETLAKKIE